MEVRNVTGRRQGDAHSGIILPPMDMGEWVDVPYDVAMRFWKFRVADIKQPVEMLNHLWKEHDGTHIFWASPFSLGDGYGTAASQMVLALDRAGIKIHTAWTWFHSLVGVDNRIVELLSMPHPGPMKVGICMATPGEFPKLPTPYKIGFTMYEADNPLRNLPEWRHDCAIVDMLLVPSEYCANIFAEFVDRPIRIMPLIPNPAYRAYRGERRRRKNQPFVFGMHGTLTGRKSPLELVDCFTKAFPTEKDVALHLKTRLGIMGVGQEHIPKFPDQRVTIHNDNWLVNRTRQWLVHTVDCYVFPSKGEGFGLPPREAMLAGCPTLFTNHTGMSDLANPEVNWPIRVKVEEESPLGGKWRIPDWDQVIETMRWVYRNREEAQERAWRCADWYEQTHGADAIGRQAADLINSLEPDAVRRPIIPPAEVIDSALDKEHTDFYTAVRERVPAGAKVLCLGFGEGVLYDWLVRNGYNATVAVEPKQAGKARQTLAENHLPVNVISTKLWELDKIEGNFDAVLSMNVFQGYQQHEVEIMLRSALMTGAQTVMFSVPTVYYPKAFGERTHLRRRSHWEDILVDFEWEAHYYGQGHRYLWVQVFRLDQGLRATTVRLDTTKGRWQDGVWHPNPTTFDANGGSRGEVDVDTPHVSVQ